MKKLIMTDLDCTLLPMNQDEYIKIYINEIAKMFYERGYDGKAVATATMKASYMMAKNDGSRINAEVFEEAFLALVKEDAEKLIEIFPEVYGDRYNAIKTVTRPNPFIKEIVELMREKAQFVVVATQPMFPLEAVEKRLSWIGLLPSQFDDITVYDKSTFCKPNVGYYKEIMDKFGATPSETVMFGNDVNEDILPCKQLGIDTFLLLDGLINTQNHDISDIRQGDYLDMIAYLKSL
ncbi:MAG: HAD family hydrolase [Ruminococcus sp.]|nr:HAD family hydrolase [Ruminococcus sp.]